MTYEEYLDAMLHSHDSRLAAQAHDARAAEVARKQRQKVAKDSGYREYLRGLMKSGDSRLINYALDAAEERGIDLSERPKKRTAKVRKNRTTTKGESYTVVAVLNK